MNDAERTVYVSEQKAVSKLNSRNIKVGDKNYETELKKEVVNQTTFVTQAEKDAVKKRVLKNISGSKYQALPPLPRIVQPTERIVSVMNSDGKPEKMTGTSVIKDKIGDRLAGLGNFSAGGDDAAKVNKALSEVMNGYLPEGIEGGAKVDFSKDANDKWSLSVSYFDRAGTQRTLPIQYPTVGNVIGIDGATPPELNAMIHEAAEKISTEESERLVNRNQRGTSKNQRKFN